MRKVILSALLMTLLIQVSAAQDQPLKVVASFSLIADVLQNVGQDEFVVQSLIPVGADPHSYAPSAADLTVLADADVVFIAGGGFEEGLLGVIGQAPLVIEISACVPVRWYGEGEAHADHDDDEHLGDDHADEADDHADNQDDAAEHSHEIKTHAHDGAAITLDIAALCAQVSAEYAEYDAVRAAETGLISPRVANDQTTSFYAADCGASGEGAHNHGACDPHVWSDPRNIALWTKYAALVLGQLEPEHRSIFAANAQTYVDALDAVVRTELEPLIATIPVEQRVLVTNHETLGYFADAYGFRQIGFVLPGGSAAAEPSARDVAGLIDLIRGADVPAIFGENTAASTVAEQIAAETEVEVVALYSDSLSAADGDAPTILEYLRVNITAIAQALSQP